MKSIELSLPYYLDCNQLYPSATLSALLVGGWKLIFKDGKDAQWVLSTYEKENENYVPEEKYCLKERKVQLAI